MHGLKKGTLEFSEYDPEWPVIFEKEKQRIREGLGEHCGNIWHIGSTAIPGLMAKPIIDIAMDFRDVTHLWHIADGLENRLGYVFKHFPVQQNHWYIKYDHEGTRLFQGHIWLEGSTGLHDHLRFVEIMSNSPSLRQEYMELKPQWAEASGWSRVKYSTCKDAFMEKVFRC